MRESDQSFVLAYQGEEFASFNYIYRQLSCVNASGHGAGVFILFYKLKKHETCSLYNLHKASDGKLATKS